LKIYHLATLREHLCVIFQVESVVVGALLVLLIFLTLGNDFRGEPVKVWEQFNLAWVGIQFNISLAGN
jgi:hypothetical protein